MTYTTNGRTHSATFFIVWIAFGVALAFIPAVIASHKGRSLGLWFLFGLLCFLPALIASLVISDRTTPPYGAAGYGNWNPQPGAWVPPGTTPSWGATPPPPANPAPSWGSTPPPPPPAVPAGWYPDPGGSASQRYWDGTQWTEHLH